MSLLGNFSLLTPRPLPVILLLDASGSMAQNDKINLLNTAVGQMIKSFAQEDNHQAEIYVAVIVFSGKLAHLQQDLQSAKSIKYQPFIAEGKTPMGAAFQVAQALIEDTNKIPSRAYSPTLFLVSDGEPTDDWESPLQTLLSSERASKAARFAMAIGDDANVQMLQKFVSDPPKRVFKATEVSQIQSFFQRVTMSVTNRSYSQNPNQIEPTEMDDFDY